MTPPPPPKILRDIVREVPDDVEKDPVTKTEPELEDLPAPEDIIEPDIPEEPVKVPFAFIEDVPVFPGCEGFSLNEERRNCMSEGIKYFVNREFNTGLGADLGLTGTNLVVVMFVVNKSGLVEQIQTRAPHPALEKEARRVISKLPEMKPGRQRGKPVPVSYTIPIRFKVQE